MSLIKIERHFYFSMTWIELLDSGNCRIKLSYSSRLSKVNWKCLPDPERHIVEDPLFCTPFLQGSFLHGFCFSENAKKGLSRISECICAQIVVFRHFPGAKKGPPLHIWFEFSCDGTGGGGKLKLYKYTVKNPFFARFLLLRKKKKKINHGFQNS